jgi:acyl dehydratase
MARYLEDLAVGERKLTPSIEVTETDALNFATQFDPQAMHTSGAIIASGWHTVAMVMRLIVEAQLLDGGPVLGLGVDELRWPTPVRPGDQIHGELEVVAITPSRSKPGFGVVRTKITARNQNGEMVLTMFPILWVPRRPAA